MPPLKIDKLVALLKGEGRKELGVSLTGKLGALAFVREWDKIIRILECEIAPLLAKGCEAQALAAPAARLAKSAGSLSLMASQLLSFVPGPVGIVCSLVNAIVCFSAGNVPGGLLELLGCIPGGKVAGKALSQGAKVSKTVKASGVTTQMASKIKAILVEMVQGNSALRKAVEKSPFRIESVTVFMNKYCKKAEVPAPSSKIGGDTFKGGAYPPQSAYALENSLKNKFPSTGGKPGARQPNSIFENNGKLDSGYSPMNAHAGQGEVRKYVMFPNTNGGMGKTALW